MLGSNIGNKLARVAGAGVLVAVIAACAASTTMQSGGAEPESISDVRVERQGDATTVTLMGLKRPVFTAFAQQAPERVVVDLASVEADQVADTVSVHDGLVKEVMLSPYSTGTGEAMTRVEITLAMPADYQVVPSADGLVIRVEPLPGMLAPVLPDADEMAATEPDPWAIVPASAADDVIAPIEPIEPAPPASLLTGIEAREVGMGSLVHLQANGSIASAESFTLENPSRLVIDLPGLKSDWSNGQLDLGTPHVKRIRVGQHADRVRVVIDAGDTEDPFQGRRIMPAATGLVVALGSGQELDWAVEETVAEGAMLAAMSTPEAEEEISEPEGDDWMTEPIDTEEMAGTDEPVEETGAMEIAEAPAADASEGPVTIYGVEYDAQDTRDRVVILGDRPVDYLLFEPSPDTVVLSIQNAVIDPEAAVRIAPEPGGPISLVTAFAQPETQGSEVRIVVKRADGLKPEVSRRGSLIVVDFPRDGSVAATPPALVTPEIQTAQTSAATPTAQADPAPMGAQPPAAVAPITASAPAPAAVGTAPAIEVLREGGLMDGKQYAGRRISLDFKDIDMSDILRLVAEVSDLNVIAGEEVQGRVTIRLVDVPWDQALDVILLTKGLGFQRIGNVLRIAPQQVLKQEEEMRLQERRNLEQLEDLIVKLQPVNYANVGAIKGMVQRLLTQRGTVDIDKRTNTLIMKDIPSVIDEATALIKAIDTQTPQVLVEAKIVEASLDFSREFGVAWGVGVQPLNDPFDSGSGSRTDLGSDAFRLNTTDSVLGNNANFINPLTANPTALFNVAGFLLDEKLNLNLQLQAAEVNGDGKVISSPRVVTLDNNKATIEQGVSIPFQTFENGDAQLEFVDAVLKLDVTPHITADRSIIMKIRVSRNAPDDSVFTLTGSPAISKNQVDTETLVRDGQTLVLGGIYVVDKSERQSRVPYLHSLPLLGALFRNNEISDARKELLIFVTPRIIAVTETGL